MLGRRKEAVNGEEEQGEAVHGKEGERQGRRRSLLSLGLYVQLKAAFPGSLGGKSPLLVQAGLGWGR